MPHVLILVENLPVPADRRVWQEARSLKAAGYDVSVICPRMRGYTAAHETIEGIEIFRHGLLTEAAGMIGFAAEYLSALFGEARLALRLWRRRRFDVIHICNPPDLLFLVALLFKPFGVRVVYDVHDACPEMFEAKFGRRGPLHSLMLFAERCTYRVADVVLATNRTVRNIAITRGHRAACDVFVVRSAPASCTFYRNENLRRGRRFLVGYVGVLGSADRVDLLLEAAAHAVSAGRRDIQFVIAGDGPEYQRLVAYRDSLGLHEFVELPGWLEPKAVTELLGTMDLGVSADPPNAYTHACTMNKVVEYMAAGKPQVTFDLRETRASAGNAAVYVSDVNAASLSAAIVATLDDEDARKQMGAAAAERFRAELNWQSSEVNLLAAYRHVLR